MTSCGLTSRWSRGAARASLADSGPTVMLAVHYYGDLGLGVANEVVMAVMKEP
jgi:hypothetical protein